MTTHGRYTGVIIASDVDRVLDTDNVARLAKEAKLLQTADLKRFRDFLKSAIHGFLTDTGIDRPLPDNVIRRQIANLNRWTRAFRKGEGGIGVVKGALNQLSPEAREYLYSPNHPIPDATDLDDPARRDAALRRLAGLTVRGAEWKPGRKRRGGKQSRDTLTQKLKGPPAVRGRPPNRAGLLLCKTLAAAYAELSGRPLPRSVHHANPGPFVRLVKGVLSLAGAQDVDEVELVKRFLLSTNSPV